MKFGGGYVSKARDSPPKLFRSQIGVLQLRRADLGNIDIAGHELRRIDVLSVQFFSGKE